MAKSKVDTSTKEPKAPRTVKLSTIIWSVSVIVALGLGFYLGVTAKTAYAESVKSEAKSLVSELKENQ